MSGGTTHSVKPPRFTPSICLRPPKRSQVTKWHTWDANILSPKLIQILQHSKKLSRTRRRCRMRQLASFCRITYVGGTPACPERRRRVYPELACRELVEPVEGSPCWPNGGAGVPPAAISHPCFPVPSCQRTTTTPRPYRNMIWKSNEKSMNDYTSCNRGELARHRRGLPRS
jgi:hypothetical protein